MVMPVTKGSSSVSACSSPRSTSGLAGELRATAVSALECVTTEARDLRQVEAVRERVSREGRFSSRVGTHLKRSTSQLTASPERPERSGASGQTELERL